MRDIKFRIWQGDKFKTIDFRLIGARCVHSPCMYSMQENHMIVGFEQREDRVFQQFTGKCDLEDNEIYEGDIVELHFANQQVGMGRYEVYFDSGCFKLRSLERNWLDDGSSYWLYYLDRMNILKIIGNIFENPELLKNGKE